MAFLKKISYQHHLSQTLRCMENSDVNGFVTSFNQLQLLPTSEDKDHHLLMCAIEQMQIPAHHLILSKALKHREHVAQMMSHMIDRGCRFKLTRLKTWDIPDFSQKEMTLLGQAIDSWIDYYKEDPPHQHIYRSRLLLLKKAGFRFSDPRLQKYCKNAIGKEMDEIMGVPSALTKANPDVVWLSTDKTDEALPVPYSPKLNKMTSIFDDHEKLFIAIQGNKVEDVRPLLQRLGSSEIWFELTAYPALLNAVRKWDDKVRNEKWREDRMEIVRLILEQPLFDLPRRNEDFDGLVEHMFNSNLTCCFPLFASAGFELQHLNQNLVNMFRGHLLLSNWCYPDLVFAPKLWTDEWASLAIASQLFSTNPQKEEKMADILRLHPLSSAVFSKYWSDFDLRRIGVGRLLHLDQGQDSDTLLKTLEKFHLLDPDVLHKSVSAVKFLEVDEQKKLNSLLDRHVLINCAAPSSSLSIAKKMRL